MVCDGVVRGVRRAAVAVAAQACLTGHTRSTCGPSCSSGCPSGRALSSPLAVAGLRAGGGFLDHPRAHDELAILRPSPAPDPSLKS